MIFDEEYQAALLAKTCDKRFMEIAGYLLKGDMFEDFEDLAQDVLKRWEKTRMALSSIQLTQLVKKHKTKLPRASGEHSFDKEMIVTFVKHQTIKRAFEKAHLLHGNGKYDKALEAMMACQVTMPGVNGMAPFDIFTSSKPIPSRSNVIPTGIEDLDERLSGGISAGELAVILAPTSGGKTSLLCSFALNAAMSGRKVYYTTLEVPDYEIEMKMRQSATGQKNPKKTVWAVLAGKVRKKGGHLWVKEHPPHTISVSGLDSEVPTSADMIVIDYADYLCPPSGVGQGMEYHDLGNIYTSLKRISMTRKIPIWTASQVNRAAYANTELRAEDVEASLRKMMVCDQAIGISQLEEPDDKTGRTLCQLFISKNRHGPRYVRVDITADFGVCRFVSGHKI